MNNRKQDYLEGDLLDRMNITPPDTVAMIGAFMPIISQLKGKVSTLNVFERNENKAGNILPAEQT